MQLGRPNHHSRRHSLYGGGPVDRQQCSVHGLAFPSLNVFMNRRGADRNCVRLVNAVLKLREPAKNCRARFRPLTVMIIAKTGFAFDEDQSNPKPRLTC